MPEKGRRGGHDSCHEVSRSCHEYRKLHIKRSRTGSGCGTGVVSHGFSKTGNFTGAECLSQMARTHCQNSCLENEEKPPGNFSQGKERDPEQGGVAEGKTRKEGTASVSSQGAEHPSHEETENRGTILPGHEKLYGNRGFFQNPKGNCEEASL